MAEPFKAAGGFTGLGYDPDAKPVKPDVGPSGASTAYETPEQEENIKAKAAGGHIINMDDLGYMGHFASDKVTRPGHNVGHKKLGVAHPASRTGAKQGFHKLPGTASIVQGRNRYGAVSDHEMGLRSKKEQKAEANAQRSMARAMKASAPTHPMLFTNGNNEQPRGVVPRANGISDVKMSVRHHRESIANDKKHAKEHMESAKKHEQAMKAQARRLRSK